MNYLAHLYLSGEAEDTIIGNFIADGVKGAEINKYSEGIKKGILLHRQIDHFTDTHPDVIRSRKKLHYKFHKYSGVVLDVFFDHFLANNWSTFSETQLEVYVENAYAILTFNEQVLPPRIKLMLPYMIKENWLYNYSNIEGVNRALTGLARRTSFTSGMEQGAVELVNNYLTFDKDFKAFFPQLVNYVKEIRTF